MLGAATLLAAPAQLLQSLRWTQPGAEIEAMTTQPAACLDFEAADRAKVQAGMALFNTPTLLGGQAAKAGLSCASCHVNGRDNPHFLLPSLSGAAGTADVTSSFFSAARGNALHDPVLIPDLAQPGKISRVQGDPALEAFIRNLIVEEFSGTEPSAATLSALASYVRAMRPCQDNAGAQERRLSDQLDLIEVAIKGASVMERLGETSTAKLAIASARHQLGLIDERYCASHFKVERRSLLEASTQLRTIAETDDRATIPASLAIWKQRFDNKTVPRLTAAEPRSLYNREQLKKQLAVAR